MVRMITMNQNKDWIDRYKVIRRIIIAWVACLITYATYAVYQDMSLVTSAVVALYGVTTGLLGLILGKYFTDRYNEDNDKRG